MNIKIEIANMEKVIEAFRRAPAVVKENMRIAMKVVLRNIQERARREHKFRTRSGAAEKSISTGIVGADPIVGRVFLDPTITRTAKGVSYGVFLHEGTADHFVSARNKKCLRWATGSGFAYSKGHEVKGITADPFVYRAGAAERANANIVFNRYAEKAIRGAGL